MADEERKPLDDLVDLLIYAPVGLLYEYDEVLPRLIRRGKSQVQLARVLGTVAVKRGSPDSLAALAGFAGSRLAERITDLGEAIGLAPVEPEAETPPPPNQPPPPPPLAAGPTDQPTAGPAGAEDRRQAAEQAAQDGDADSHDDADSQDEVGDEVDRPLPIAGYDNLTAREVVKLLDDLDDRQLARIRAHEQANRARKTVLGKLDRLEG